MAPGPGEAQAIGKTVLQLKNVHENGNYTCTAESEQGLKEASTIVNVEGTAEASRSQQCANKSDCLAQTELPRPPRNLKISEVTSSSVNLSWYPSEEEDQVKYYVVQYKPRDSVQGYSEISGITTASHTVTNLRPYTLYEFQVLCVNDKGRGPPSDVAEMTTLEAEPGSAPRNVRARPQSSTSLFVEWDQPMSPNGQIAVSYSRSNC